MTPDDLERLLGGALDARAHAAVPDHSSPPAPRFEQPDTVLVPHRRRRYLAPLAAAAVVAAVGLGVGLTRGGNDDGHGAASQSTVVTVPAGTTRAPSDAQPVKVALRNEDGQTYGVGMPVIAYFSRKVTDARSFQRATTVTVDGKAVDAEWYFEASSAGRGPLEAHLRPQAYWPAHATVHVVIAARGLTAGAGLGFSNDLTLDFTTGARLEVRVDSATNTLAAYRDGTRVFGCHVALGARSTPTLGGVKVIMEKHARTTLSGAEVPGAKAVVQYAQRLTYGGEYLLAAPWIAPSAFGNPKAGDVTRGSTDLTTASARALYGLTRIGDIVQVIGSDGPQMQLGAGYGDWNVSWGLWRQGGAAPTH